MIWEGAHSAEEVSQKTGMPIPIVHARASKYRKAGVKLKKMRRYTPKSLDVDAMNQLIEEIRSQQEVKPKDYDAIKRLLEEILEKRGDR